MGCIQRDGYIRALLHQPDESEMDIGMSRGESVCYHGRSRRFGDCCESKNGCGTSVEEQAVLGKFRVKLMNRSIIIRHTLSSHGRGEIHACEKV